MFLCTLMMVSSAAFVFASSPIFMSLNLILFIFLSGIFIMKLNHLWFFYALVIMFLGGMMVVFVYASSLVASSKTFNKKQIFMLVFFGSAYYILNSYLGILYSLEDSFKMSHMTYSSQSLSSLMFLATYLLLNLLILIKLIRWSEGPLKNLD